MENKELNDELKEGSNFAKAIVALVLIAVSLIIGINAALMIIGQLK